MLSLVNESPWDGGIFPGWGRERHHQMTLVVKAGYRFDSAGQLDELFGVGVVRDGRHYDDPLHSSLAVASEVVPFKAGAEVVLTGTAYPPEPSALVAAVELAMVLSGGERWAKRLRVTGRRVWQRRLLTMLPGEPEPMGPTELRYELAYGGMDRKRQAMDTRNPVGLGFAKHGRVHSGQEMPRIEIGPRFITSPADVPVPAGFGPLAPGWEPRLSEADCIDGEALRTGLCPYDGEPPETLYNCAPADQRFERPFSGGEQISLRGFFPQTEAGVVNLRLPQLQPQAELVDGGESHSLDLVCDTLTIDTDTRTLALIWRTAIPRERSETRTGWVVLRDGGAADSREGTDEQ